MRAILGGFFAVICEKLAIEHGKSQPACANIVKVRRAPGWISERSENRRTLLQKIELHGSQVDIWRIDLRRLGSHECRRLLSPDEVQRADGFCFEKHQRRFTVARAAMRQILGLYAGVGPENVVFCYSENGKPGLSGGLEKLSIDFNLSHSGESALLAVARGLALGIDIELINAEFATEEIAARFFSTREVECLEAVPVDQRVEAFFCCWTRKEAYIKALGEGLSLPLDSFEVAFGPGVTAALLAVRVDPAEVTRWSMYDIKAPEPYKAALVAEGTGHLLRHLEWDPAALPELPALVY